MGVSEIKLLKTLEDENARLKKLLVEQMLDMAAMKNLLSKNGRGRREARVHETSSSSPRPVWQSLKTHPLRG